MKSLLNFAFALCALLLIAADQPNEYASWTLMQVPGTWDEHSEGKLADYDGFAWYRSSVTISRSWAGKDLELRVEKIDNAHEVYFNGAKIGGAGAFPPNYKSGLGESKKYVIKAGQLKPGDNVLAIRVYDHDGAGGFKGGAPVLVEGDRAIALNGNWEFRTGDDVSWAKGPIKVTNTAIFWRLWDIDLAVKNSRNVGFLSPEESSKRFTVPDELEIKLVLAEPVVRQPLHLSWDERGRLWVVQFLQYPDPAGLKMVSKDKYWRAVYDKIPPPPPNHFRGIDKITIHEDTNGDGKYDKHKTFLEGTSITTACVRGRGGVWVLNPPYLLFYPDKNNDDVPDGDPQVLLQGFGMEDTHSVANSLRWGPDGWLYAAQGSTVSGNVMRPGLDKKAVHSMGQLIWRYHPETHRYEIFAEGGGNAFGVEIDEKGRIYSGHNGGNTRGFHYVQGGYYRKGFSKHGPLSNPYSFGFFEPMGHHTAQRFTHNFVIYAGGAFPEAFDGKLYGVEPIQGRIVYSEFEPDRSSFKTTDLGFPVTTTDGRFRPVEIKVGPDGAIYIADMYEPKISHREHHSGQIDKSSGRIYRLQAKNAAVHRPFDLGKKTTRELIDVLKHKNKWYRQAALRLFGDRKDGSVIPTLKNDIRKNSGQFALECLWALNLSGGFNDAVAMQTLEHEDPTVRQWTVRLLCDPKTVSPGIAKRLAKLAKQEAYVHVRSQLASSAKRLPAKDGLPIVRNLLTHDEDADDIHLPLLLWWAIEDKAASNRDLVVAFFADKAVWSLPIVREHLLTRVMQRYAASGSRNDMLSCAKLLELSPDKPSTDKLMAGFEQAFKGRSLAGLPTRLVQALAKSGGGSLVLGIRRGDAKSIAKSLEFIANPKAEKNKRLEYITVFGEVDQPASVPVLLDILGGSKDDNLNMAALTALQRYADPKIGAEVVTRYNDLSQDVRTAAQTLLASRQVWSRQLLEAVDAGKVDRESIPLDAVRLMTIHRDDTVAALIRKHWASIKGASTEQMQNKIATVSELLKFPEGSDPYNGKKLFTKSCGKCHLLFGEGGRIGPDLTAYKRDDKLRILLNVVNPSAEIREGFETFLIITEDGRTVNGFLYDQDANVVVLRGVDGQSITIARDRIDEMIKQRKSIMPEGLLKDLSSQEIRDLFAYLRSSQPLNN